MKTRIQKWGNSLALRIPKAFALEARIQQGSEVELVLDNGKLVVSAAAGPDWTLAELLAGITPRNLHGEMDAGSPTGAEVW